MPPRKPANKGGNKNSSRGLTVRVKSARGRKISSTKWLSRQLNDPYVTAAQKQGYRSRAAFKLTEIDDKFRFLKKTSRVVDLGCAPGGWLQVALERCPKGQVVGIDLTEIEPVQGATILVGDVREPGSLEEVRGYLDNGQADVVISDMAAASIGHSATDHVRVMALIEIALDFAEEVLTEGGAFAAKVLLGGTENQLLVRLKRNFKTVKHVKPPASRADSSEQYLVATGFRGRREA
jgi:23S rRNA (uridine2552-2'-O)-methyltransferase